ncbi:lectin-like domain-containing protein [Enterococcus silesiacus]
MKNNRKFMNLEYKKRYKMYKVKKSWVVAPIVFIGLIGLAGITTDTASAAEVGLDSTGRQPITKPQSAAPTVQGNSQLENADENSSPKNIVSTEPTTNNQKAIVESQPVMSGKGQQESASMDQQAQNNLNLPDVSKDNQETSEETATKENPEYDINQQTKTSDDKKSTTIDTAEQKDIQSTEAINNSRNKRAVTDGVIHVDKDNFIDSFKISGTQGTPEQYKNRELSYDKATGILTLTDDVRDQAGTATLKTKISTDADFILKGQLNIGDKDQIKGGADGIGIGFSTDNTGSVGHIGGGVGIAGLLGSSGWKVDTFWDTNHPNQDLKADPKEFQYVNKADEDKYGKNGQGRGYTFAGFVYSRPINGNTNTVSDLETDNGQIVDAPDGKFKPFTLEFNGETKMLTVIYNNKKFSKDMGPDLAATNQNAVNLIISAGTGSQMNRQQFLIESLDYTAAASINVKYIDENKNEIAHAQVHYGALGAVIGETYSTQKLDIKDYTFSRMEGDMPASGKLERLGLNGEVIYVYQENKYKLVIGYTDTNGKELLPSETPKEDYKKGDTYETSAKVVKGYYLTETPANATGTFTTEDISVTYVYKKLGNLVPTPEDPNDPNFPETPKVPYPGDPNDPTTTGIPVVPVVPGYTPYLPDPNDPNKPGQPIQPGTPITPTTPDGDTLIIYVRNKPNKPSVTGNNISGRNSGTPNGISPKRNISSNTPTIPSNSKLSYSPILKNSQAEKSLPQTGEVVSLSLWSSVLGLCMATLGIVGIIIKRKTAK